MASGKWELYQPRKIRLYSPKNKKRYEVYDTPDDVYRALKEGLVPSVTQILDLIKEDTWLQTWIVCTSLDHFIENKDYNAAVKFKDTTSADFGTTCHDLIDSYLTGDDINCDFTEDHVKHIEPFKKWADKNISEVLFTEKFFASEELGYGGTADMLIRLNDERLILGDLKFKKNKSIDPEKTSLKTSFKYKMQVSGYRDVFKPEYGDIGAMNFLLSSPFGQCNKPCMFLVDYEDKDWSKEFQMTKELWYKKYLEN